MLICLSTTKTPVEHKSLFLEVVTNLWSDHKLKCQGPTDYIDCCIVLKRG